MIQVLDSTFKSSPTVSTSTMLQAVQISLSRADIVPPPEQQHWLNSHPLPPPTQTTFVYGSKEDWLAHVVVHKNDSLLDTVTQELSAKLKAAVLALARSNAGLAPTNAHVHSLLRTHPNPQTTSKLAARIREASEQFRRTAHYQLAALDELVKACDELVGPLPPTT